MWTNLWSVQISQSIHKKQLLSYQYNTLGKSTSVFPFLLAFFHWSWPLSVSLISNSQVQWEYLNDWKFFWEVADVFSSGSNLESSVPFLNFGTKEKQVILYPSLWWTRKPNQWTQLQEVFEEYESLSRNT